MLNDVRASTRKKFSMLKVEITLYDTDNRERMSADVRQSIEGPKIDFNTIGHNITLEEWEDFRNRLASLTGGYGVRE